MHVFISTIWLQRMSHGREDGRVRDEDGDEETVGLLSGAMIQREDGNMEARIVTGETGWRLISQAPVIAL